MGNLIVEIARAFAIAGLYKQADIFPILILLRLSPGNEAERQVRPTKELTPGMLAQSIETEMASLLSWMDKQQSPDVRGPKLLFFWADRTGDALAEIDLSAGRLSIDPAGAGLPVSLFGSFAGAMSAISDQMDCSIEELSLVRGDEWPKMLVESPDALPYLEYRRPLIAYLREALHRYPRNMAYLYHESCLTYAELESCSDKLASLLAQRGVAKGDLVFIALDNSLELPVAYLACMKLGAVFVPTDTQWPEGRCREMAESIRPKAVIAGPGGISWAEPSSTGAGGPYCALITGSIADWQSSSGIGREETSIGPDDLLYGFFTSGSTGMPKCALNTQKGAVNRFLYMDKVFGIRRNSDVILQNSNLSFDSSLWQLLWPLLSGCKIVIPRRKSYIDIDYTLQLIAKHRVTMTDFVPSVFNLMLYKLEANPALTEMLASMKVVLVGGEAFQAKFIPRFYRLCPWVSLINTYGHTEATIGMGILSYPAGLRRRRSAAWAADRQYLCHPARPAATTGSAGYDRRDLRRRRLRGSRLL